MNSRKVEMKTIAVMSQKGGAGKTTLAVHLAVAAHKRGLRVAVLDTDPQESACIWAKAREADEPTVAPMSPIKLKVALEKALAEGFDVVIVDTAPNAGTDAVDVASLATKVVIPVRPSVFDLSAAKRTIEIVRKAGVDSLLVLSACPHRAPEIMMAREALCLSGLPVADTAIGDRRPYARAVQTGRAVIEFEPEGKAAEEINALLNEVLA
jgi:chromosome partitioning protein